MKSLLIALISSLALISQGAEPAKTHRLEMTISKPLVFAGEISGTYEIKNGSLEIQIKRGYVERTSFATSILKRHVTGVILSIFKRSGDKSSLVIEGDKIVIDKVLDIGEKVRLKPQTIIIKHPSITLGNSEKQWISACIEIEIDGSSGGSYGLDDVYFYGTREKLPASNK